MSDLPLHIADADNDFATAEAALASGTAVRSFRDAISRPTAFRKATGPPAGWPTPTRRAAQPDGGEKETKLQRVVRSLQSIAEEKC